MRPLILFLFCCFLQEATAQLSGLVLDEQGNPSPFTSIYVQNTSKGTISNEEGYFHLELEAGTYSLVFDRIGFKKQIQEVTIGNTTVVLNVTMVEQAINLAEVEVLSGGEDPAYPIIRKAMEKP